MRLKRFTYQFFAAALFLLLFFSVEQVQAQWALDVVGTVKKEETKKRFEGVTITVKRNGTVWKTLTSESSGKFQAALEPDAVYVLEFSKPGHVTKRIEFSTKNVPPDDAKYGFEFPMEMNLFEKIDGLDVSILNKPIAKVAFDPSTGYMDYDAAYTKSIKNELDRLRDELEARLKAKEAEMKQKQKDYDEAIAAADKAFNSEKWAEAKPLYEKASKIFPEESYPLFQLGQISDKLAASEEANKRYNTAIAEADKAFAARDWDKATMNYQKAASYKPEEKYPADKLKEIKDIIANEKKVAEDYNNAIAAADQFFGLKEYEKAKAEYQKASALKSYEDYPKTKIAEIDKIIAENQKKDQEYNAAITKADDFFKAKDYEKAIASYTLASGIKTEEKYPKDKIAEANQLLAAQKKLEEDYNKFIKDADAALAAKEYQNAQSGYQQASAVKPNEQYPKDKLNEIKSILEELAKKEAEEKQKEAAYQAAIANGDKLLGLQKYDEAKQSYVKASEIKAEEKYPKDKIAEIDGILADLAKKEAEEKAKNEQYQKLITEADGLLSSKEYDKAKTKYQSASDLKAEEKYPKDKIAEIDGILADLAKKEAEEKAKNEQYQKLITEADGLLSSKEYDKAKTKYQSASAIKAEEKYPKDKIAEIDGILADLAKKEAEEKAKNEQYQKFITDADNFLNTKKYDDAKNNYNQALGVKPNEQYPKDKLKEIENILAEIAKKKAEEEAALMAQKEKDEKYQQFIAQADNSLGSKKYDEAKTAYNQALGVKPNEQYPKDKLAEIENILAEIAKKKAEEEASMLAEKVREEKYQQFIKQGDSGLNSKKYDEAKTAYNQALGVKPNEQYPKDKLKEIENILAEIAKKKAEEDAAALALQNKEQQYQTLISQAEGLFNSKDYENAKIKYYEASNIKKEEQYPRDRINEITKLLADLAQKEADDKLAAEAEKKKREYFNAVIAQADGELAGKNYDAAKKKYNEALSIIPTEEYPKTKIGEIDDLLAKIAAEKENAALAQKERDEKYNGLISQADNSFSDENYQEAKGFYQQALGVKPNEAYPKDKLLEIDILLKKLAEEQEEISVTSNAQKQKLEQYNKLIKMGDEEFAKKSYKSALAQYTSASSIMPSELYPKEKITEINKLLSELALNQKEQEAALLAEKQKREQYDQLIYEADRMFRLEKYNDAKYKYEQALALYQEEKYPKQQLAEIATRLSEKENETIVVKNTTDGPRVKIDDSKEKELEAMMADLLKNRNSEKGIAIQKEKDDLANQEEVRVSTFSKKLEDTHNQLVMLDKDLQEQRKEANKYHLQNHDLLKEDSKKWSEEEANRVNDSEKKRQNAKDDIIATENSIKQFNASQDKQLEDKVTALYTFADEVNETNLILVEEANKRRANNKKDIEEIAVKIDQDKELGEKRRKERELNLREYEKQLTEQNNILIKASKNRREYSRDSLVDLVSAIHKQQLKSSKYYELNVELLKEYQEDLKNLEQRRIESADRKRDLNNKEVEAYEADINEKKKYQEKKYYEKTAYLKDYKNQIAEEQNQRTARHNDLMLAAKNEVNEEKRKVEAMQKEKSEFHLRFYDQVEKDRAVNQQYLKDMQLVSHKKISEVSFDDVYMGEKHHSENLELANKYPQGISEETYEEGNAVILRRIKITGNHADVYEKKFYKWGGVFYTKNGYNITETLWDLESIEK